MAIFFPEWKQKAWFNFAGQEFSADLPVFQSRSSEFKRKTTELDLRGANDNQILTLFVQGYCEKAFSDTKWETVVPGTDQKNRNTE